MALIEQIAKRKDNASVYIKRKDFTVQMERRRRNN
jgi:hypothetical protein